MNYTQKMIEYTQYIQSTKWKHKRLARLKLDKFQCRTCRNEKNLEVHHVSYKNFRNEPLEDLITLCKECHKAITNVIRHRRYSTREVKFENENEVSLNYVETTNSEVEWGVSHFNAQRTIGKSAKSSRDRDEEDFGETF